MIVITPFANMSSENEPVPAAAAALEASEAPGAAGENKPEENADKPEEKKDDEGDEDNDKKRKKKKKSPKKKSRPPNFNDDDDNVLFAAMEVTLPHGQYGWKTVTAEFNAAMTANGRADRMRSLETLKAWYTRLHNHKKPTGDPL